MGCRYDGMDGSGLQVVDEDLGQLSNGYETAIGGEPSTSTMSPGFLEKGNAQ